MNNEKKHDERSIAIALDYKADKSNAPKIVASGRGYLAEHILEIAFANNIKVREDADLAQILTAVEVDSEIPLEAFTAVAEILSYVYAANNSYPKGTEPTLDETEES